MCEKTFRIAQTLWHKVCHLLKQKRWCWNKKDDAFHRLNNTTLLKMELFAECKKLSIFVGENVRIISVHHQCPFSLVGCQCPLSVSIFIGQFSSKHPFSLIGFYQNCFSRTSRIVSVHFHWWVFIKTSIFMGRFPSKLFFQDVQDTPNPTWLVGEVKNGMKIQ